MVMVTKAKKSTKKSTKKRTYTKHITKTDTHFMVRRSLPVYAVLVFLIFALLSMSIYLVDRMTVQRDHSIRHGKITKIYTDLNLGETYRIASSNVFGDKRVYKDDHKKSHASRVEYGHNATVAETRAEIAEKAKKAGFSHVETITSSNFYQTEVFKNSQNNYLRVSVLSRTMHNDLVYGTSEVPKPLNDPQTIEKMNYEAPSYVVIAVNLDDNNE